MEGMHRFGSKIPSKSSHRDRHLDLCELIVQFSRDILLVLRSSDGRILEVNTAAEKAYGLAREELLEKTIYDLRAPRTIGMTTQQMAAAQTEGVLFETLHQRGNGEIFPVEVSSRGARMGDESILVSIIRDISARRDIEQALRDSELKFAKAFMKSPNFVFISELDTGSFRAVNNAFCRLTGHSRDTLIGRTSLELGIVEAGERERLRQALVAKGWLEDFETHLRTRNGEVRTVLFSAERLEYEGRACMISSGMDITDRKRIEEALTQSERHYRELAENSPEVIARFDSRLRHLFINDYGTRVYGLPREKILGRTNEELGMPAEKVDFWRKEFEAVLAEGRTRTVEFDFESPIFGYQYFSSLFVPEFDAAGRVSSILAITRDITQLKKTERELRQNRTALEKALIASEHHLAQLNALVHQMTEGMVIFDPRGNLLDMNPAALAIHGFEDSDALKMHLDRLTSIFEIEDLQGNRLGVEDWPIGRVLRGETFNAYEVRVRRLDTGRAWIGSYGGTPVYDRRGDLLLAIVTTRDVTENKSIEAALRRSEEHLRNVLDNTVAMIGLMRTDGTLIEANRTALEAAGLSARDVLYKPFEETYWWSWSPQVQERLRAAIARCAQDERVRYDDVVRIGDQRYMTIDFMLAPIRGEDGRIAYLVPSALDITDRKRAEEELYRLKEELEQRVQKRTAELIEANRELEAFSYSVSHDLRSPLRSMDGFSRILLEKHGGNLDERGRDYLSRVRNAAQRMGRLIDDLLELSRVGRTPISPQQVDLSALCASVVEELRQDDPKHPVQVVIAPDLKTEGDARLMRIVVENLIGNAWKFTSGRPQARIEIGTERIDGRPVFFVRDNGAGFEMEYVAKLFGPFQRLHSEKDFPGTGIGLSIVKRIVKRHAGRIWAEGGVNAGATFYFTIGDQHEFGTGFAAG